MNNTLKKIMIGVACGMIAVGIFFIGFFSYGALLTKNQRAVLSIIKNYEKYYYFEEDGSPYKVADALLDEYSEYYSVDDYTQVDKQSKGLNVGVGLAFKSNTLDVISIIANSPAEKTGVKAGGKVISITANGNKTPVSTFDEFSSVLDGVSVNTTVEIELDYGTEIKTFSVKKAEYRRTYVSYADKSGYYTFSDENGSMQMVNKGESGVNLDGVAYIKYHQFSGKESGLNGSVGQLTTALDKAKNLGNSKIILDLRGNGGGNMKILCDVARLLVEPNGESKQVIAVAKDKNGKVENFTFKDSLYNNYGYEKIIILADENTASASETLIGAMLEYDTKGIVTVVINGHKVGENTVYKTYGKGIMQTTYLNPDGSAVKLTTAVISFPKSGISIHGTGITTQTSPKVINADGDALITALNLLK